MFSARHWWEATVYVDDMASAKARIMRQCGRGTVALLVRGKGRRYHGRQGRLHSDHVGRRPRQDSPVSVMRSRELRPCSRSSARDRSWAK
jgi:hypothetical protein